MAGLVLDQPGHDEIGEPSGRARILGPQNLGSDALTQTKETALRHRPLCLALLLGLAGCGALTPADFAGGKPLFEPEKFFTGHVRSWGVMENRSGEPTSRFTTEITGRREGDSLVIEQHFAFDDGRRQDRIWRLRRLDAQRYEATADDVVGTAAGAADGNAFRWEYTIATSPGNSLKNVQMTQWMYGVDDGARMMNRVTVKKLGIILAEVTEFFNREPD
jgi:Protein of unknown function (DUF3833)